MAGGGGGGAQPTHKSKFSSPVPRRRARIEIIPLIDVMFFLLAAFMMVSLSMQKLKTPKMELPATVHASSDFKPNALNVAVDRQGQISVGKTNIPLDRLDEMLSTAYKRNTNNPVFVSADRETTQGDVNRALFHIRTAGFQRVSFSVTEAKGK
jgi:biopolymer transport protein ExbD